ncbi:hypothetical protein NDU88_003947 [Pleurodeles waltl]|uniref:Uncharacterized protein n=1 Tax=Pleurodeles waltl TaxID=8319 RepID=A0AAV7QB60_PLEWA|nr:hypothetical protein NDU88_003947 [Pleurodeles waltl]
MGQAKGLEWAKKMVAAQGVQQLSETPAATNTDEVQPSDSGLCLLSEESVAAPAKRKRPARAAAGSKLKRAKKDMADSNLPEGLSTSQKDSGPRRARKDNEEQEAAGTSGVPLIAGGLAPGTSMPIAQEQINQPARSVACSPTLGASGQGLQGGLGKMMEAMHSFMASAKALAGLGMDEQGASNRSPAEPPRDTNMRDPLSESEYGKEGIGSQLSLTGGEAENIRCNTENELSGDMRTLTDDPARAQEDGDILADS